MVNNILLASHGTDGARAAEAMALAICSEGGELHHLLIVPEFWQGMTGDDWLNNGSTRDRFRRYVENQLDNELTEHCDRVRQLAEARGLRYVSKFARGKPEECLLEASDSDSYDLVVIGSPRPKHKTGLRSRIKLEPLTRGLKVPLVIAPYPDE